MQSIVCLYSVLPNEINRFLNEFYETKEYNKDNLKQFQINFQNPIEITDMIGAYIENDDNFKIGMWVSIDNGVFIKVTQTNADELIRYMYERFPY